MRKNNMKFGDQDVIRDGSLLEGSAGIVWRHEDDKAVVLLEKEVLWPLKQDKLELSGEND